MASYKRGGARGGSTFKKPFTKKRSAPDADADADNEDAPRASKKSKAEAENDDESLPVVPELKTDDNGDAYISVSVQDRR
jgi:hypothetical protein